MSLVAPAPRRPETLPATGGRPTPRSFRPDIQGLRTIAIVTVALYHAGVPFLRGGYVGVDVFFVISGFLITRQLFREASQRGTVNLVKFYSARFRRLLPPVLLVITATLALARFVLPYDQLKSLISDTFYASFYGVNYHFAQEGVQYQNATVPPSAIQHFWSLAVEEQFYVVWPLLIIICAVIGRRRYRHALTFGVIAVLSVVTFAYSVAISSGQSSVAYFSLQTRAWELGAGALIALSAGMWALIPAKVARVLGWAGLAAILFSAVDYTSSTVYPGYAAGLPVLGAALLIGSGVLRNDKTPETALLQRPFMQYGGKVSYAWYLWHWPMLILLPLWVGHALNTWENVEIVCLAFWFAVMTYFLENYAHRTRIVGYRWARIGLTLSACVAGIALISSQLLPSLATTGETQQITALTSANLPALQAQISLSTAITALPSNLTPKLAKVGRDWPDSYENGCFAALTSTKALGCVYGDKLSNKVAVLIGDSHADQWLTPLRTEAAKQGWRLVEIAKAACTLADYQLFNPDLKREYRECDTWRTKRDALIKKLKPQLIIASQSDNVVGTSMSDGAWATGSVDKLKSLAALNKSRVVYIEDSNNDPQDALSCMERNPGNAQKCTYQRPTTHLYPGRAPAVQAAVLGAGFGYLATTDWFCNSSVCPPVVKNIVVHRDQGHVTNTYATYLAPMMANVFSGSKK